MLLTDEDESVRIAVRALGDMRNRRATMSSRSNEKAPVCDGKCEFAFTPT
jgi:hypothetical protein